MAGIGGEFVCTGLIGSSVCCCVKTSELENVCFIGCQDIFGALHFIASDLVFGCMKVFYHRVLSYLLGPVSLCSSCFMGVCSNDFEPNLFVACFLPFVVCTTGVFLGHCA